MIEVNAVFDKKRVLDIGKGKRISNYIIFPVIALALVAGGVVSLIRKVTGGELVLAIVLLALAPAILIMSFFMTRSETKNNIASFGVDKGDVVMNYRFGPTSVLISRTAQGKTVKESMRYDEFYKVKRRKQYFLIYVNKDEIFYVPTDCFESGTPDELFKLFYDNKVILDY